MKIMLTLLVVGLLGLSTLKASAQDAERKVPVKVSFVDKGTRKGGPLNGRPSVPVQIEAWLVIMKSSYEVSLGGDEPEQFRKKLADLTKKGAETWKFPPSPALNAKLVLKNVGNETISFNAAAPLTFTLEGNGAVNLQTAAATTPKAMPGKQPPNQLPPILLGTIRNEFLHPARQRRLPSGRSRGVTGRNRVSIR